MKFAPEGSPFILFFAALSGIAFWFGGIGYAFTPFTATIFVLYFFRDPERSVPADSNIFVSPADGKVIVVRNVLESEHLNSEAVQISIFMSPFNVHVNRAPCDGRVMAVMHKEGKFLAAYRDEASLQNEHIDMVMETAYGNILVRQVAGFVARRAVCRKQSGDVLNRGERYGIIKFSSRVDVCLPVAMQPNVKVGDRVKAGETILGRMVSGRN